MTNIQAWSLVSEKRAMIYQWLSGLFARELSDEQFNFYQAQKAEEWFSIFEIIGLEEQVSELKDAIKQWTEKSIEPIDLRSDFASLFLMDNKTGAIPYASCYVEHNGLAYGAIEMRMRNFLSSNHLEISSDFKEPADHVAVYLALMQAWILNTEKAEDFNVVAFEQADFLEKTLLNWLPIFVQRCQGVDVLSSFYPAAARLLLAFIKADMGYLKVQGGETPVL